jgi:glycosyltransferase involved in cell wall biosynthesis
MSLLKDLDVHLSVLGDGDAFEHLGTLARTLGVEKRVSIEKTVSYEEIPNRINRSDIGILPFNDWHGWNVSSPIKLFEYLACGKPVVVTEIPAHRNVLKDARCAFWAKESSPEQVASAIRRAYESRNDFERLSKEARALVLRDCTWQKQAEKLKLFCYSLLRDN